jgi:membrane-bound metal-dependent hydrolase YbcI (DUF457 family)
MLGRTHALTGAAACAAIAATAWHPGAGEAFTSIAVTAGAALLPDIDHPDATVSRTFGFLTRAFSWLIGKISGGHRHGTHSLPGVAAFIAAVAASIAWRHSLPGAAALTFLLALLLAAALRALRWGGHWAELLALFGAGELVWNGYGLGYLPWLVGLCALTHIAGDMLTKSGCPLAWPASLRRCWLLPRRIRFTQGCRFERWMLTPALALLLASMAFSAAYGASQAA